MRQEFKEFILRGNVVDMAIGVIIGAAFGAVVTSLVNDVVMPPIGLLLGGLDFANLFLLLKAGDPVGPYRSLAEAQGAGAVTVNYGVFLNAVVGFLVVAVVLFLLIRAVNRMRREEEVIERANRYLMTSMVSKIEPVVVNEAKGAIVKDVAGKEYIDLFSGISVVNAGHCQQEITDAMVAPLAIR